MAGDKRVRGITVAVLAPTLCEFILLVSFEHRETPNVIQISLAASISSERGLAPCSSCEACELALNAHVSRSMVENWISSTDRNSSGPLDDKHGARERCRRRVKLTR
jgi:hypothetical protein